MEEKLVGSVKEAAKVLQISSNSAYEACKSGDLPSTRMGGRILVLWKPFMRQLGDDADEREREA